MYLLHSEKHAIFYIPIVNVSVFSNDPWNESDGRFTCDFKGTLHLVHIKHGLKIKKDHYFNLSYDDVDLKTNRPLVWWKLFFILKVDLSNSDVDLSNHYVDLWDNYVNLFNKDVDLKKWLCRLAKL